MNQANADAVVAGLSALRNEQRALAEKISDLQSDLNEHRLVMKTLEGVDQDRRCFRMIGGVLVERKVGEIMPALASNTEKIGKLIESLEKQLTEKGKDINSYIEKNNIQIRSLPTSSSSQSESDQPKQQGQGILVGDQAAK